MPFGTIPRRTFVRAAGAVLLAAAASHAQPVNDQCVNAVELLPNVPTAGSTVGATFSLSASCQENTPDIWFVYDAVEAGPLQFTATGQNNANLSIAVMSGCSFPIGEYGCAVGAGSAPLVLEHSVFFPGESVYLRVGDAGTGQSITVTAGPLPPPPNDECAGAIPLTLGTSVPSDNLAATLSFGLTNASMCQSLAPGFAGVADVFYSFTPQFAGFYDISTCMAEIDTIVSVHSACPASPANMVACNDNGPRTGCGSFDTHSSFLTGIALNAGTTYIFRVAAVTPEGSPFIPQARFSVKVDLGQQTLPPANDLCASAEVLPPDGFTNGSTVYATGGVSSSCGFNDVWDVWYTFTSTQPVPTIFGFEIFGNSFDNQATLSAYTGCGGTEITCQAYNPLTNPEMRMLLSLQPNQTILLRVAGAATSQDAFIMVTTTGPTAAPNGSCAAAAPLALGTPTNVDLAAATSNPPSPCGDGTDAYGLWYSFQAPSAGFYRFGTEVPADSASTMLSVYGTCGAADPILCRLQPDSLSVGPLDTAVSLMMTTGQTAYIRAAQTFSGRGQFTLTATGPFAAPAVPTNDACPAAQTVSSLPFDVTDVNITTATPDANGCGDPPTAALGGVWYRFIANTTGQLLTSATTNDETRSAQVMVFDGSCGSLTAIGCPDFSGVTAPTPVTAGVTYHLLVSVSPTREDQFLNGPTPLLYGTTVSALAEIAQPPANDTCSTAQRVTTTPASLTVDTLLAGADAPQPSCIGRLGVLNNAVWYVLTTQTAGTLTVHGERSSGSFRYSPGGALFSGTCGGLSEVACDSPVDGLLLTDHFDLSVPLLAGQSYYLMVGSFGGEGGAGTSIDIAYTGTLSSGPACIADFNRSGTVTVQDIFDFLAAYFSQSPSADVNNSGSVTVQDIFDFLASYFAGCA